MLRSYYTIQRIEAWNEAKKKGYLEGNRDYIWKDFLYAYSWMMKQMRNYLNSYNNEYPIWLWVDRPDLRRGGYLNPNTHGILLEVLLAEEKVLLSDYESWHCVLMDGYVANTDEELDLIKKGKATITKEESWKKIFDLGITETDKFVRVPTIQGVTGRIYINEIKPIKEFMAKNVRI